MVRVTHMKRERGGSIRSKQREYVLNNGLNVHVHTVVHILFINKTNSNVEIVRYKNNYVAVHVYTK